MIELSTIQESALREIGNIGAGHAATALSQLMGKKITIAVPVVQLVQARDFLERADGKLLVAAVYFKVVGDAKGGILFYLSREEALKLADALLKLKLGSTKELGQLEESALKETGSILSASYLSAASELTKMTLIPSVPRFLLDSMEKVFQTAFEKEREESPRGLIVIENVFIEATTRVTGHFLFMPDEEGLSLMLEKLSGVK